MEKSVTSLCKREFVRTTHHVVACRCEPFEVIIVVASQSVDAILQTLLQWAGRYSDNGKANTVRTHHMAIL